MVGRNSLETVDAQDSDLDDLLGNQVNGNHATKSMSLDHLTRAKTAVSPKKYVNRPMSFCQFLLSYVSLLCDAYPKCCGFLFLGCLFSVAAVLMGLALSPSVEFGKIEHNVFAIQSKYDLHVDNVDHWCLRGGDNYCSCEDPLIPKDRSNHESWKLAHDKNKEIVNKWAWKKNLQLAILGESVVEAMTGRWMGETRSPAMERIGSSFDDRFGDNSKVRAVALGIAGDTAPNVLWRLRNGEVPDGFNPDVWWISLGMNDLARMECSEEIVTIGILRVVEELMEMRPGATIVINSLLPMVNTRGGAYPLLNDYSEAFKPVKHVQLPSTSTRQKPTTMFNPNGRVLTSKRDGIMSTRELDYRPMTQRDSKVESIETIREKRASKKLNNRPRVAKHVDSQTLTKLNERKRMKRFRAKRKQKLPLWRAIKAINSQLDKFAASQQKKGNEVYFYDATKLFVMQQGRKTEKLRNGRITLLGYPRPRGFEVWLDEMAEYTENLLKTSEKDSSNGQGDDYAFVLSDTGDDQDDLTDDPYRKL